MSFDDEHDESDDDDDVESSTLSEMLDLLLILSFVALAECNTLVTFETVLDMRSTV